MWINFFFCLKNIFIINWINKWSNQNSRKKKTIKGKNFINWKISTKNIKYKKQEKIEIETLEKKNQV